MFADFPQMRLRRSPPDYGGLPQMKKEQPTPHLRLPFREPYSRGCATRSAAHSVRVLFVIKPGVRGSLAVDAR